MVGFQFCIGEADRRTQSGHALRIDLHPACDELRIGEDIGDRIDRPCRNADLFQTRQKVVALPLPRAFFQPFCQRRPVRNASSIGGRETAAIGPAMAPPWNAAELIAL